MTARAAFTPQEYQYPEDSTMLAQLSGLRDLQAMVARFIREIGEPWISGELAGTGVRVSSRQFPEIHVLVTELAAYFAVPLPHIYLIDDGQLNAFTHGIGNQSFIALTSRLFQQLDTRGLCFVLGHEIGHIHCRHVLYTTMCHWLLGQAKMQHDPQTDQMLLSMLSWMRMAEISADRAGLLACGDRDAAVRAALTMLVGSAQLATRIDIDEYISEQCLSLEFNPLALQHQDIHSHPYMPFRLCELNKYAASQPYQRLRAKIGEPAIDIDEPITINFS